ncbi:structural maintenance of chromosomes protein 5-like [Tubulanus polymorphus]|uniref:structural maintenance of chromosomes protein 5-like n=1 Tax=Tubulanus polymorphus TaxID=672921 RepID=UPI003DA21088
MAGSRNSGKYQEGAIVRIRLENFMTYDSVEFCPGAHLNVIVAPNGTGKSTLVNAICLGLAGKTSFLGRASGPHEFVKHGCNRAIIEIELYNPDGDNYIIHREINKSSQTSTWSVNGRHASQKAVEETMGRLNIQVGNLCQFLPQDKVADFAKMTPQELLRNTEKAVGPPEMLEYHDKLKNARQNARGMENKLQTLTERLESEKAQNARLEHDVNSYRERQRFLDRIEMMKKKRCWVEYENMRIEYVNVKERHKQLGDQYKKIKKQNAPFEEKLKQIDAKAKVLEGGMKEVSRKLKTDAELAARKNRDIETLSEKMEEVKHELKSKKSEESERAQKAVDLNRQIKALESDLASVNTSEDVQPEIDRVIQETRKVSHEMTRMMNEVDQFRRDKRQITNDIGDTQRNLNQVLDIGRQRLEMLHRRSKDTYEAVKWLRSNKDQFKGTIHEPVVLCLNVKDQKFAPYIEQTIAKKDMFAFICEESDDLYKFLSILRKQQGLKVAALKMPPQPVESFQPRYPLEQIKRFGFYTYLREMFTCPDAVMRYLCAMYKVHCTPVGDRTVRNNLNNIMNNLDLQLFYTPENQYFSKRSKYGNHERMSRISQLRQAQWLTVSVNVEREQMLRDQLRQLQTSLHQYDSQIQQLMQNHQQHETRMNELRTKKNELAKKKDLKKALQQQIAVKKQSVERLEAEAIDIEKEEDLTQQKLKAIILRKAKHLEDLRNHTRLCLGYSLDKVKLAMKAAENKQEHMRVDEEFKEQMIAVGNLERELTEILEVKNQAKENARLLIMEAKKAVNLKQNEELTDDIKNAFKLYPNQLEELEAMIQDEQARADCAYQVDEGVIRDYKDRKKNITNLEVNRNLLETKHRDHQSNIENMKRNWFEPLQELISKINDNFHKFFAYLQCAGEVSLHVPENDEDYEEYGVLIKVQYRSNEQLRVLSTHTQSGGERSVATVLYMMALQELARCPFRCVDEINQGMDAFNERRVYELVVKTACRENTSQYFLLTPKLLPDLDYTNNMTVLCIYNGVHMLNHTEWNIKKYLRRRARIET